MISALFTLPAKPNDRSGNVPESAPYACAHGPINEPAPSGVQAVVASSTPSRIETRTSRSMVKVIPALTFRL